MAGECCLKEDRRAEKSSLFNKKTVLPKENRLNKKKDFERVFKRGKGFKEDFLFIKIIKNDLETSRFGFIVSQKISKKAVIRNKIKRRMRESVRTALKDAARGYDIVFLPSSDITKRSFKEINEAINKALIKIKILQ